MNRCTDLYVLSAIACKFAECLDTNQLNILSADLQALGEMLEVIVVRQDK